MRSISLAALLILSFMLQCATTASHAGWVDTIAASHPLNWYQFEEADGEAVLDSGSEPYIGQFRTEVAPHKPGRVGSALDFSGPDTSI
jgi:hypothetical protein